MCYSVKVTLSMLLGQVLPRTGQPCNAQRTNGRWSHDIQHGQKRQARNDTVQHLYQSVQPSQTILQQTSKVCIHA